jgi:3-oxoacyl-[acyl-carrier protein] reductase
MVENDTQRQGASREPLLKGRIALVTGASRGIGAATAKLLAWHGAAVGVNYYSNTAAASAVVESIQAEGGRAVAIQGDVGDPQQINTMVQRVDATFGPIDTLVLNADAVRHFTIAPFTELTWEQYEDLVLGETKAIFLPAQAVVPSMIERGSGCIIAVSSGLSRFPRVGMAGHSSGKAAVDALVRVLAAELGPHGIRVNTVAPGLVETDTSTSVWNPQNRQPGQPEPSAMLRQMTPLRRIAQPEDIAGAIVMLASDAAGFITGQYIAVNGGSQML